MISIFRPIISLDNWLTFTQFTVSWALVAFAGAAAPAKNAHSPSRFRSLEAWAWQEFAKFVNGYSDTDFGSEEFDTPRLALIPYVTPTPTATSTIGNALGVAGLGFLLTKELAVALNTPILIPFMLVVHFIVCFYVLLFPNVGSLLGI